MYLVHSGDPKTPRHSNNSTTQVFCTCFRCESPHRSRKLLRAAFEVLAQRRCCLSRTSHAGGPPASSRLCRGVWCARADTLELSAPVPARMRTPEIPVWNAPPLGLDADARSGYADREINPRSLGPYFFSVVRYFRRQNRRCWPRNVSVTHRPIATPGDHFRRRLRPMCPSGSLLPSRPGRSFEHPSRRGCPPSSLSRPGYLCWEPVFVARVLVCAAGQPALGGV